MSFVRSSAAGTFAAALILSGAAVRAQSQSPPAQAETKQAVALRISEPIRVDGQLDEAPWRQAAPAVDFVQQEPDEGQPATRRTEVRFVYDDTALYFGAMLYDDAPELAITNELKRDFDDRSGDMLGIVLDTFLDRSNSYGFVTNPGGAQRETQAYDNGERNDPNWDGIWFVRTAVHDDGWSVEGAIPFKTLRFPDESEQRWGLNIARIVRRTNEVANWSHVPRPHDHYNVGYAGVLTGISGVRPGHNLRVTPFTVGKSERSVGGLNWDADGDGGVDLKWAVTPSLVLDGTYRTDFAQVEADEQQINITRFNLRFPEKRQFFLESPGSFQIGFTGEDGGPAANILTPFFTRRIGLSEEGTPIPVVAGARLTGRAGATGIGLLNMQTDNYGPRPGDNFTAVRLSHDVGRSVAAGGFYFGREAAGTPLPSLGAYNRVFGGDVRFSPSRTLQMETTMMGSATDGPEDDLVARARVRLRGNTRRGNLEYLHIGERFRHDLGFVRRGDIGMFYGDFSQIFRPRATRGWAREHELKVELQTILDSSYDREETRTDRWSYIIGFADGGNLRTAYEHLIERLTEPFEIRRGIFIPVGEHDFGEWIMVYQSDRSKPLSGLVHINLGTFWTGTRRHLRLQSRWRLNAHLAASVNWDREWITLETGAFRDNIAQFRVDSSLTTRMFLNAFVQYNGARDQWQSNVRFNFIHRPLSDIYVVWNETWGGGPAAHGVILKYTHSLGF
jgi:hypothetical protein